MQKIYFEKMVDLNHQLSELLSISVDEAINYKIEDYGMKAQGAIEITGEFLKKAGKERFNETLEIDLLAPFEKVIDQRDFNIKVEDFDYRILEGNLLVTVQANVYGVVASEDKHIEDHCLRGEDEVFNIKVEDFDYRILEGNLLVTVQANVYGVVASEDKHIEDHCLRGEDEVDIDLVEEIKEALQQEEIKTDEVNSKEVITSNEGVVEQKREDKIEDLIEISDQQDLVPYYIHVSVLNDTYESISSIYNVPENIVREYNKDKTIEVGSLIVIPYYEP